MQKFRGLVDDLVLLVLVIEAGSFTAASARHDIPVSRLSRRIALLEDRLGTTLLKRNARGFSVTEAGNRVYDSGVEIRTAAQNAMLAAQDALSELTGHIRICCPFALASGFVTRLCLEFVKQHEKVSLTLELTDGRRLPPSGDFDLFIVPSIGELPDSNFVSRVVGEFLYVLVASPAMCEQLGMPKTPSDLVKCPAIGWSYLHDASRWTLIGPQNKQIEIEVDTRFTSDSLLDIHEAVRAGLGVARLPVAMCAGDLQSGALQIVAPGWAPPSISIHALYPSRRNMSLASRALLQQLLESGAQATAAA